MCLLGTLLALMIYLSVVYVLSGIIPQVILPVQLLFNILVINRPLQVETPWIGRVIFCPGALLP